jgi:hypothetical protein
MLPFIYLFIFYVSQQNTAAPESCKPSSSFARAHTRLPPSPRAHSFRTAQRPSAAHSFSRPSTGNLYLPLTCHCAHNAVSSTPNHTRRGTLGPRRHVRSIRATHSAFSDGPKIAIPLLLSRQPFPQAVPACHLISSSPYFTGRRTLRP